MLDRSLAILGCGNFYLLCSHPAVSALVSVLAVLFHTKFKADPATNPPGSR